MDSGVPQGTVLGPILFLLHINNLPSIVSSKVRLFADDCLIYKQIKNNNDQIELQRDLNLLESWGAKWGMRFNPAKCNIMRVSRKRSPFLHSYTLSGQVLGEVEDTKYLGVTLSNNLDWSKHITTTTTKANARLSFIKRNLKDCPKTLKELAYFSLVRSFTDYCSTVWDPHQKYNHMTNWKWCSVGLQDLLKVSTREQRVWLLCWMNWVGTLYQKGARTPDLFCFTKLLTTWPRYPMSIF